jgi:Na+/H+-dicarboxylate symporter
LSFFSTKHQTLDFSYHPHIFSSFSPLSLSSLPFLQFIFVNVIFSVVDMMSIGTASTVAPLTFVLFLVTTVMAAVWACLTSLAFKGLYETESFEELSPPYIVLGCSEEGSYLAESTDGNVVCSSNVTMNDPDVNFIIKNVTKTFVTSSGAPTELSISDALYQGIFQKTVSDNIIRALSEGNFAAIIFLAFSSVSPCIVLSLMPRESNLH